MPARSVYEYAIIRVVPRVERGEQVNAGVALFCKGRRFLAVAVEVDEARVRALDPAVDLISVREQLTAMERVAAGDESCGPLAKLTQAERFRWLAAPRSTVVQPSAVHVGECLEPEQELRKLMRELVGPLGEPRA